MSGISSGQTWRTSQGLRLIPRIGAPFDLLPADRPTPVPAGASFIPERIGFIMDLQADKGVDLGVAFSDEVGNPVPAPAGATVAFTVDNTDVIALTDNGDGTGRANATGVLGNAIVHTEVTMPGGAVLSGDGLLTVVAGDAERVAVTFGDPTEVTPDAPAPEPAPEPAPVELP